MTDNRLNKTGLQYYHNRIKTIFAQQAEVNTLSEQVAELIAVGGEPNVIDSVSVNNVPVTPDAQKNVNVVVPTTVSELSDASEYATKLYVDENGGKIDVIKVNGTAQTITNKTVDLSVPKVEVTKDPSGSVVSTIQSGASEILIEDLENGSIGMTRSGENSEGTFMSVAFLPSKAYADETFRTEAQVQEAIDAAVAGITGIDFQIVTALPASGIKGVIYLLSNSGSSGNYYDEYIWIEGDPGQFEKIGTTEVDLTGYYNETNLVAITSAEIDEIIGD